MEDTVKVSKSCKKDAEGNTFHCLDVTYKGKNVTYDPCMPSPLTLLESLDKFQPRDGDIWLLSYGKSGTHWLYEVLLILNSGELKPASVFKSDMMVEQMIDINSCSKIQNQRIFNTHFRPKFLPKSVLQKSKMIHIIRNPKSVAVSFYYHITGIQLYEYEGTFAGLLPTFLDGPYNIWGNWFEHTVEMWEALRHKENALIITFEDLKKNGTAVIKKIADFLELDRTVEFCSGVAQLASFDKMSQHVGKDPEQVDRRNSFWKRQKHGMFRKCTITDWKNTFTVAQNEHFDKVYNEKMAKYPELKALVSFE